MSTQFEELFTALAKPFSGDEIKTRAGSNGARLQYVTWATVANRLDAVVGPEAWDFAVTPWGDDALIGTITIRMPDGTAVSKSNVGGRAGMKARDDDAKSAASDCLKRCAALFGVGRHLHPDGEYAEPAHQTPPSRSSGPSDSPPRQQSPAEQRQPQRDNGQGERRQFDKPPQSGKALFAWTKDQEQRYEVGLLKYLNSWGKLNEYPNRMVDWDEEMVALAYEEAIRKLRDVKPAEGQNGHPAPSRPAGGADNTPPAGDDVNALRKRLINLLYDLGERMTGVRNSDAWFKALASINEVAPDGEQMEDPSSCQDPDLFRTFIELAQIAFNKTPAKKAG